jgi:hypothetical protein
VRVDIVTQEIDEPGHVFLANQIEIVDPLVLQKNFD